MTADAPSPSSGAKPLRGAGGGPIVVAIDGPAGVGKSDVARAVARHLGLSYLDTGAMYRAIGWLALRGGVDLADEGRVAEVSRAAAIELLPRPDGLVEVRLDGEPVEAHIRSLRVSEAASRVAAQAAVRERLVELQRDFGRRHGAVMEGRDIGSVVFPDTPFKFFLDARPDVRIARRLDQLHAAGRDATEDAVRAELDARDRRDRERAHSPLAWDPSYERVDTSEMTRDEVVAHLAAAIAERAPDHVAGRP